MTGHTNSRIGVAQTGFKEATDMALKILDAGGNATDAAVAALLMLTVCGIGTTCLGGEVAILVFDSKTRKVTALSGQGGAAAAPDGIDWFMAEGASGGRGIRFAAAPALLGACVAALKLNGTMSFAEVARPTLARLLLGGDDWYTDSASGNVIFGSTGEPFDESRVPEFKERTWHADLAQTFEKLIDAEKTAPGDRLRRLDAVTERFYRGDIARYLSDWYRESGGFLRETDLARFTAHIEEPVSVEYRGYSVFKCGPWSQGPYLAQALKLLEVAELENFSMLGTDHVHTVTEAINLALADRDAFYGDPLYCKVPLEALLSNEYARIRRLLIERNKAHPERRPGDPQQLQPLSSVASLSAPLSPGTTTCAVTDSEGNVVVATPSGLGSNAGSGGITGITHGTRLTMFNASRGHPNCIEAGKRPRTTLSPTLVTKNGKPWLALSVPGGDLQDQAALQIVSGMIDFGLGGRQAVAAPRFYSVPERQATTPPLERPRRLKLLHSIRADTLQALSDRGHNVSTLKRDVGGIAMLTFDQETGRVDFVGDSFGGAL